MSRTLRKLRPWVQLLAFLLFLFLALRAGQTAFLPADLFYRLDPLAGIAGMLAARTVVPALVAGTIIALVLAVIFGRAWCGWLCPLGTMLDWTPARRLRPKETDLGPQWRRIKYWLLIAIFVMAALGNLTLIFLDPITLVLRTVATSVWPAVNAMLSAAEMALYPIRFLQPAIDGIEGLRGTFLPAVQPSYASGILAALLFAGILSLNAVRRRFWCRYVCPLGALLGLVSKVAVLRRHVSATCVECARCARACPTGTIEAGQGYASDPAECIVCLDCLPVCSKSVQGFAPQLGPAAWREYDPSRRQFLAAAGIAAVGAGLLAAEPPAAKAQAHLVRPPGAVEPAFSAACIRCGLCVRACPTSGLQPALGGAGWSGAWTPVLVARLGHCDYSCNACGQVCPTGAIPRLPLEEKQVTIIGLAYIDRDRCIPWANNVTCLVCEEMCPLPDKAIKLDDVTVALEDGSTAEVRRPYVVQERCIGCGICENRCPLTGPSAIRVWGASAIG